MLQLSKVLLNRPVLSLRVGGAVATALEPIINPDNLKIEGWFCQDRLSRNSLVLLTQSVRDIIAQGIVINDHEDLAEPQELVRLKDFIDTPFTLIGKPVYTTAKHRLGKVTDYAAETTNLVIQKLYITQPLLKSLTGGTLSIDRKRIVEITDKKIIVQDTEIKEPNTVSAQNSATQGASMPASAATVDQAIS